MKKNNKGFSLVELIVVVLIMGIIAVALAPQIMKWVNKARTNTDNNQIATIKSTAQSAVADYMTQDTIVAGTYKVVKDTNVVCDGTEPNEGTNGGKELATLLTDAMGDFPKPQEGSNFYIHVTDAGKVTVDIDKKTAGNGGSGSGGSGN